MNARPFVSEVGLDLTYVLRRLARRPLYAASVIGVLATAIGGALTVFGWVHVLVLQPLDVPRPHELMTLQRAFFVRGTPQRSVAMTWGQVARVRSADSFSDSAVSTTADDRLSSYVVVSRSGQDYDNVAARFVTANYMRIVGVQPLAGRDFQINDDEIQAPAVGILTERYWRDRFQSSADVVGSVVRVNGVPVTVVGVVRFDGVELVGSRPALFLPLAAAPAVGRDSPVAGAPSLSSPTVEGEGDALPFRPATTFQIIARVPGANDALQAEMVTRIRSDEWSIVPLSETMLPFESRGALRRFLAVMVAAVALALVVACINVGMLLYGEAQDRRREFMTRTILGATASRVMRLLAVEYGILALASGLAAGVVAAVLARAFATLDLPGGVGVGTLEAEPFRIAGLAVALTVGVASAVAFIPLIWVGRRTLTTVERTTTGLSAQRSLRLLATVQAAGCVAIAVVGVFFARTVSHSLRTDLGFEPAGLSQVSIRIPAHAQHLNALTLAESLVTSISTVTGVQSAAIGPAPIVTGSDWTTRHVSVDGTPSVTTPPLEMVYASQDYFDALRPSGFRGRNFSSDDEADWGRNLVAIVNEAAATMFWPGADPLGHRLTLDEFVFAAAPTSGTVTTCRHLPSQPTPVCTHPIRVAETTIVGVVPNMVLRQIGETARPVVYLPLSQWRGRAGTLRWTGLIRLLVRTERPSDVARLVAQGTADWRAPVDSVAAIPDALDKMTGPQRLAGALLLSLAGTMLLVTLTGIYASTHMAVRRNLRANAVRLALGATASGVVVGSLLEVGATLTAGSAVAALGVWWAHPFLESFGLGMSLDLLSTGAIAVAVTGAGVVAAYVASRSIYHVEPARLLRE